jgi:uncharacterized protein YggE
MRSALAAELLFLALVAVPVTGTGVIEAQDTPQITVTGEALVQVVPDKVTIIFGIETWDKDIELAKQQNSDILDAAYDVIRRVGVRESDVQTDHLSIAPRYDDGYRYEDLIGYFVRNSVSVVLREPDDVEELITGVLATGVTHIHGVNFETSEFKRHREEARRLALEAAREKGEKMAAVLGLQIGDPVRVSEDRRFGSWSYYGGWWGYGRGQGMSQNVVQNVGEQGEESHDTIALGKISIRANVTVTFRLTQSE